MFKVTRTLLPMNLQLFAEEDPTLFLDDETEETVEETTEETTEETEEETEEKEESSEETTEETTEETEEKKTTELDDNTPWIKKRLARAERSFERKFMEEAASLSDGVQVARDELPKATRLWNVLKHNPELSSKVDELINNSIKEGKLKSLKEIRPESRVDEGLSRLDLREAELDLRYSDPVYKKYEKQIKDYAEDEGIDIVNAKALKLAYKAWRGENSRLLMAEAEKKGAQKATQKAQVKKSAALAGGRAPVRQTQLDYRKASDKEILSNLGMSLFTDED